MDVVLLDGGTIVQPVTVEPPVGSVIVLAPLASVLNSIDPGLAVLDAADTVWLPVTSLE